MTAEVVFWTSWGLIAYAYVGFPLLMAAAARLWGAPDEDHDTPARNGNLPSVSLLFAAHNEEAVIAAKTANCAALVYPRDRFEVLVGSDGSTDATDEILRLTADPGVRVMAFAERRGKISVINDLAAAATGEILVMTDASTMLAPDAAIQLAAPFADPRVGCVTGELSIAAEGDVSGEGFYLRYERWIKRAEGRLGCVVGCVGANFAMRRDLYEPLPPDTIVEDLVLCLRVLQRGYRAVSAPRARAVDPPCTTARAEMGRKVRIGAGAYQAIGLARGLLHPRHGIAAFAFWGHKVARWLVPFFVIAAAAANVALLDHPFYAAAAGALLAGALVAVWAYRRPQGSRVPRWTRPISYFYLMNYALLRGFARFVFRSQSVTWERAPSLPIAPADDHGGPATPNLAPTEPGRTAMAGPP